MNINLQPMHNFQKLSNIYNLNFKTANQIRFKGNIEDSFEKNTENLNPNTAFIYDKNLSVDEKLAMVKESPILMTGQEIAKALGQPQAIWFKDKFFEYDVIEQTKAGSHNKSYIKVFDLTQPINKQNLQILKENKDDMISSREYKHKYNFDAETYKRYTKDDLIEEIELINKNNGTRQTIPAINTKNPKSIEAPKRLNAFQSVNSKYHDPILLAKRNDKIMVNVMELTRLGFGSYKHLAELIDKGILKGSLEIKEKETGKKRIIAKVDMNDFENQAILKDIKRHECVELKDLAERSGVRLKEIEDCILEGSMKGINERILPGDPEDILIDVNDPKNIETFDRLLIEKKVKDEIIRKKKETKKEENASILSLRSKIAWALSVNTRNVAKQISRYNPELKELTQKQDELEEILQDKSLTNDEKEFFENELREITKKCEIEYKIFYKNMWEKAGTEEFKESTKKAIEIIKQYKEKGIESITDKEIQNIIKESNFNLNF